MSTSCELILDDIEDILGPTISKKTKDSEQLQHDDLQRAGNKSYVIPKQLKKQQKKLKQQHDEERQQQEEQEQQQQQPMSNIPGMASIYIKTWGCTHNNSDSEYMAGQLASYGYTIVDDPDDAHLWLLNSCTVKNPAEDHFKNYIDQARRKNKYIVVAGCVPQGAPKAEYIKGLSVIGVQQIDRIIEVVEETLKGNSVRLLQQKKSSGKKLGGAKLSLPKIRKNPLIEIIAINTGCLNECTYCKTKHARGELGSYPPDEIVSRIKQSFDEGCVEIWLTSEDTGAYGRDIGTNIVELMWQIVPHIPDGCMLRIGMTNPPYILEHIEQMALILQHPRIYSFLHIPVQSGSDAVLADMKREYSCDDFKTIVDYIREKVPGINIATDFICGFPTETEQDFDQSMALVDKYKFGTLFINQFFLRPGTPAQRMRQIPSQERKRRTKLMSDLFHSYTTYEHKLGTQCEVLVTEHSSDAEYFVGHNKYYEQILVPKLDHIMGKVCLVEIVSCDKFSMKGKLISVNNNIVYRPIVAQFTKTTSNKAKINEDECCGDGAYCCNSSSSSNTKPSDSCCSTSPHKTNSLFNFIQDKKDYALTSLVALGVIVVLSRITFKLLKN